MSIRRRIIVFASSKGKASMALSGHDINKRNITAISHTVSRAGPGGSRLFIAFRKRIIAGKTVEIGAPKEISITDDNDEIATLTAADPPFLKTS